MTLTGLFISDGKQIIKLRREMNDEGTRYKMCYSDNEDLPLGIIW